MRIGRLQLRKPWTWLPDCTICKIPVCGTRHMYGGTYNCDKKLVWDETQDMDKVREWTKERYAKPHPRHNLP